MSNYNRLALVSGAVFVGLSPADANPFSSARAPEMNLQESPNAQNDFGWTGSVDKMGPVAQYYARVAVDKIQSGSREALSDLTAKASALQTELIVVQSRLEILEDIRADTPKLRDLQGQLRTVEADIRELQRRPINSVSETEFNNIKQRITTLESSPFSPAYEAPMLEELNSLHRRMAALESSPLASENEVHLFEELNAMRNRVKQLESSPITPVNETHLFEELAAMRKRMKKLESFDNFNKMDPTALVEDIHELRSRMKAVEADRETLNASPIAKESLAQLQRRIAALESNRSTPVDMSAVTNAISALETRMAVMESRPAGTDNQYDSIRSRLEALEARPEVEDTKAFKDLVTRVEAVESRPAASGSNPELLASIHDRIKTIESRPTNTSGIDAAKFYELAERVTLIEQRPTSTSNDNSADIDALTARILAVENRKPIAGAPPLSLDSIKQRLLDVESRPSIEGFIAPINKDISALQDQVNKLEKNASQVITTSEPDTEALAQLSESIASLQDQMNGLKPQQPQLNVMPSSDELALNSIRLRLNKIETNTDDSAAIAQINNELDTVNQRLAAIEQAPKTEAVDPALISDVARLKDQLAALPTAKPAVEHSHTQDDHPWFFEHMNAFATKREINETFNKIEDRLSAIEVNGAKAPATPPTAASASDIEQLRNQLARMQSSIPTVTDSSGDIQALHDELANIKASIPTVKDNSGELQALRDQMARLQAAIPAANDNSGEVQSLRDELAKMKAAMLSPNKDSGAGATSEQFENLLIRINNLESSTKPASISALISAQFAENMAATKQRLEDVEIKTETFARQHEVEELFAKLTSRVADLEKRDNTEATLALSEEIGRLKYEMDELRAAGTPAPAAPAKASNKDASDTALAAMQSNAKRLNALEALVDRLNSMDTQVEVYVTRQELGDTFRQVEDRLNALESASANVVKVVESKNRKKVVTTDNSEAIQALRNRLSELEASAMASPKANADAGTTSEQFTALLRRVDGLESSNVTQAEQAKLAESLKVLKSQLETISKDPATNQRLNNISSELESLKHRLTSMSDTKAPEFDSAVLEHDIKAAQAELTNQGNLIVELKRRQSQLDTLILESASGKTDSTGNHNVAVTALESRIADLEKQLSAKPSTDTVDQSMSALRVRMGLLETYMQRPAKDVVIYDRVDDLRRRLDEMAKNSRSGGKMDMDTEIESIRTRLSNLERNNRENYDPGNLQAKLSALQSQVLALEDLRLNLNKQAKLVSDIPAIKGRIVGLETVTDSITKQLAKMEKDEELQSFRFPKYTPSLQAAPKEGQKVRIFGAQYPVTRISLARSPMFPALRRFSVMLPQPERGATNPNAATIRYGLSSYPRSFLPFKDAFGPPSHRVRVQKITVDGYEADYSIGLMSDFGQNYISAVVNIQLKPGQFFVVRMGYQPQNMSLSSTGEVAKDVHRLIRSISVKSN